MISDVHTHVFHPKVVGKVLTRLSGMGFALPGSGVIEDLLSRAASGGIERVVCHSVAMTGDQTRPANTFTCALARREKVLADEAEILPFGSVHPDYPYWADELDRLEKAGIRGIKVHPNFQNLAFDDPRLFPVMEEVGTRFLIMCHVGCEKPLETNPASPYKLAKLLSLFPKARIISAHLGGYADGAVAYDALAGKDLWLDTSNTGAMDRNFIRAIVAKHPREKLLFGSDYPLYDPGVEVLAQQERLGFTEKEMHTILHNADALFA